MRAGAGALLCALTVALAACGDGSGETGRSGGEALGGSAETRLLAKTRLRERPSGSLVWVAHEVELRPGERLRHRHEPGFVFARRGRHSLDGRAIAPVRGAAVPGATVHLHAGGRRRSVFWEIRLARPGSPPQPGARRRIFSSDPLKGMPARPLASFILVTLPPGGGRTTVHTHPGPELIYTLSGEIDYQNGLIGSKRLEPGKLEGIPPGVPVQKRNPTDREATFLSWFLVDPKEPFAPRAEF